MSIVDRRPKLLDPFLHPIQLTREAHEHWRDNIVMPLYGAVTCDVVAFIAGAGGMWMILHF